MMIIDILPDTMIQKQISDSEEKLCHTNIIFFNWNSINVGYTKKTILLWITETYLKYFNYHAIKTCPKTPHDIERWNMRKNIPAQSEYSMIETLFICVNLLHRYLKDNYYSISHHNMAAIAGTAVYVSASICEDSIQDLYYLSIDLTSSYKKKYIFAYSLHMLNYTTNLYENVNIYPSIDVKEYKNLFLSLTGLTKFDMTMPESIAFFS